jgi:hypothetical protein
MQIKKTIAHSSELKQRTTVAKKTGKLWLLKITAAGTRILDHPILSRSRKLSARAPKPKKNSNQLQLT